MKRIDLKDDWQLEGAVPGIVLDEIQLPCQVHDALLDRGRIENPNITGRNRDRWIGENVWVYRKTFSVEEKPCQYNLKFDGIDTFADISLNGIRIGRNESAYLPLYMEDVPVKPGENLLEVTVYPPGEILKDIELPEKYQGRVMEACKARVFRSGFMDYSGPRPDLVRMGIYGAVTLEEIGLGGFREVSIDTDVNSMLDRGRIRIALACFHGKETGRFQISCRIYDPQENLVQGRIYENAADMLEVQIEHPLLWYPRTHGQQPLYRIELEFLTEGRVEDTCRKWVGFRRIEQKTPFQFVMNHLPVKIYGANLAHADTMTGCYPRVREKLYELLDLAELANFNCLRIWGESEILDDDFYEECDRRGILLWQDFALGWGMYSEEPDVVRLCKAEAETLVKRLKHHPSILLWCGGNELFWSRDMVYPGTYCFGEPIVTELFSEVCSRLDPGRYYHVSSPAGGRFSNDPLGGDTHGYTHVWFVPGREYPVFLSENCRVSAPVLRTMRRMMTEEELWPDDYQNICTKRSTVCWPAAWSDHNTNDGEIKTGPIEHYYEAENARELIYRLGAAHCEYIKKQVERFRRGRPAWDAAGGRRTMGHLLWKFNNNSNIISYGIVDYFNEPQMAYYALKRAYEPLQVSFSIEDTIGVWAVNDTIRRMEGIVRVSLMDLMTGTVLHTKEFPFACDPDESILLGTLDSFGQFPKNTVLHAEVRNKAGFVVFENTDYTEIERRLKFPAKGRLSARVEDGMLVLSSDTFARSVELIGDADGDEFGWLFEDNYFDLLPGNEKRIRICGKHSVGKILIRPYYWEEGETEVEYSR